MKNSIPLAIILKKTENGYVFQSLQDLSKDKHKNKKNGRKAVVNRAPNRLIKQIGLSSEQVISQITPQPQPLQQIQQEPQQNAPVQQPNQQEQVSCQVDRETILPETPAFQFDINNIHEIQRKQMAEYFMNKQGKTPEIYAKYRNFIYEAFKRNPKRYLTKISCRRMLRGDVNSILRIHTFLQKYGIINFGIDYEGNYTFKSRPLFKQSEHKIKPQTSIMSLPEKDQYIQQKQIDVDNMTITPINKNFSRSYRANCSTCKLVCGVIWFANISDGNSNSETMNQQNICFQCFQKIPKNQVKKYQKVDIIKSMQVHGKQGKSFLKQSWSVQQNLKLLDFMSSSNNQSWKNLLDNLGGKRTIEDVILQFLQFPISNIDIEKLRKQTEEQIQNIKQSVQIGYDTQDYFQILQNFYKSSVYVTNQCKQEQVESINQVKTLKKSQNQIFVQKSQKQILGIKHIIQLINQKTLTKISYLRERENIIQLQLSKIDSTFSYRKNIHTLRQDQPISEEPKNSTLQIDSNQRIKLTQKGLNKGSSSQFLQNEQNQNQSNYQ